MDRALRINTPGNSAPVKIVADVNAHIYGITGKEPNDIWAVGNSTSDGAAEIYHSADRGVSWSKQFYRFGFGLLDIAFQSDGRTGFASGSKGAILRTLNAGQSWEPATLGAAAPGKSSTDYQWWQQPWRIPAPLSLLGMFLALFLLIPVLVPEVAPVPTKQTIASVTVSDAPIVSPTDDTLGFGPVARAISGLLRNKGTKLPLTLAITAKWGRGKTSLMSLVQQDLKQAGWRTVWFNAWHHQEELSLLAALLQTVRQKAPPTLLERNGARYRLKLLAARLMRWQTLWVAAACLVLYNSETAVHGHHPHMYGCAAQYLYTTSGGDLKPDESLCDKAALAPLKLIATTGTNQQKSANAKTVAGKAGVTTQQKPLETAANAPLAQSPNPPREKPGVLQFLMRLIFDAALKLEVLEQSNRPGVHIIPLFVLVTLVTVLGWQILQSFGANPAEFLTPETARHNVSEIEARTSFLEKFRKQYGDVVGALGKYRLAIFVDDLDRCRPDKISEMLEATNYLMAAGPCAMVMALEEQAVIAGLGLSFSRMAEEFVQLPQSTGPSRDLLAEAYAKRQAFGKQYVEKLLNIVVQVPAMDTAKFGRVLAGSGRTPEIDAERSKRRFRKFAELARVPAAAIVLATIILVGGSLLSGWLLGRNPQKVIVPNSAAEQAGAASTGNSVQSPTIGRPSVPAAQPSNTVPHPSYVAAISAIPHRWFTGWRQSVAWFFILVAVAATTLAKRPPPTTTDSAQFLQALKVWAPVLADVNPSPRAAKRLLNRLRYLAMLERESAKEPEAKTGTIPEPMLVALGILEVATPVTLESASAFQSLRATVETAGRGLVDSTLDLARQAMRDHAQQFGNLTDGQLNEYRVRFLDLSAGITAR